VKSTSRARVPERGWWGNTAMSQDLRSSDPTALWQWTRQPEIAVFSPPAQDGMADMNDSCDISPVTFGTALWAFFVDACMAIGFVAMLDPPSLSVAITMAIGTVILGGTLLLYNVVQARSLFAGICLTLLQLIAGALGFFILSVVFLLLLSLTDRSDTTRR
jgi:hypothetical protein